MHNIFLLACDNEQAELRVCQYPIYTSLANELALLHAGWSPFTGQSRCSRYSARSRPWYCIGWSS